MYIIETHRYHLLQMAQIGWVPIAGPVTEGNYLPWKKINDARQTVDMKDLVRMETVGGDSGRRSPLSAHHYTSSPAQWCPSLNRKPLIHITSFLVCFFLKNFFFFLIWGFSSNSVFRAETLPGHACLRWTERASSKVAVNMAYPMLSSSWCHHCLKNHLQNVWIRVCVTTPEEMFVLRGQSAAADFDIAHFALYFILFMTNKVHWTCWEIFSAAFVQNDNHVVITILLLVIPSIYVPTFFWLGLTSLNVNLGWREKFGQNC